MTAIYKLLSPSIGDEKAQEAVRSAARALGLSSQATLSMDQALRLLEKVAETPGLIGVTARFAKSRLHLAAG